MTQQVINVQLNSGIIYVSGTVNGAAVTWTNTAANTWQATADKSDDGVYDVELSAIDGSGTVSDFSFRLYYGVLNLITDRTQADVNAVKRLNVELAAKIAAGTATEEDFQQFETPHKGAYNAEDFNRVGAAIIYEAGALTNAGYPVEVELKTDWQISDEEIYLAVEQLLAATSKIRARLATYSNTPLVPSQIKWYNEANDIEKIILDVDNLRQNMIKSYVYAGEIYAGEVW